MSNSDRMKNNMANCVRTFACALLFAPLLCWSQEVLKFNHTDAPGGSRDRAAQLFAKKVADYTAGRYRVLVFHSGQLGSDAAAFGMAAQGQIDFVVSATGIFAEKNKALNLTGLPYLVDTYEQGWKLYDESKWIKTQFDTLPAQGVRILSVWEAGFRSFTTKSALQSPDDTKNKTIRIYKNEMLQWTMEAIGFKTKVMGINDVYVAIQKGEVEGQENPVDTINSLRIYEVAPVVTLTRHVYSPLPLAISEQTWSKIPPADQAGIKRAAVDAAKYSRLDVKSNEDRLLTEMQGKGARIGLPEIGPFRAAVEPVYAKARAVYGKEVDALLSDANLIRKQK